MAGPRRDPPPLHPPTYPGPTRLVAKELHTMSALVMTAVILIGAAAVALVGVTLDAIRRHT